MRFDTRTLIFILSLILVTQVIALYVQYRTSNRTYRGIEWWLLGSSIMALGFVLMPMVKVESLLILAMIANPLLVLGQFLLFIGLTRFFNKNENRWILGSIYTVFILTYYYFMFTNNDISSRTVVINITLAIISILTAYKTFSKNDKSISSSTNFTASIFFCYGVFLIIRAIVTLIMPPAQTHLEQVSLLNAAFIIPTIASNLWTFGFILMVNQRLNDEICLEKDKMQLVFNTSPDATTITRLSDGLFLDINVGFCERFGYKRDEVIGISTAPNSIWHSVEDRKLFLAELNAQGLCENSEYVFRRKDGSQFNGMISASLIVIQDIPHIVSVIRDITERKLAEQHIQELIQQLEFERNTAQENSNTDSLTGLANRRYFDAALKTEFYRLKRSGGTLSLIMLDIDHFKNFNDSYGHLAGDDCLQKIGIMLEKIVGRSSDTVARYGGEEFVVILPETESAGAQALAESIRRSVEELAIPHASSETADCVTVSLGVVSVNTTGFISPLHVVALADEALYRAKNKGRNRVEVSAENKPFGKSD